MGPLRLLGSVLAITVASTSCALLKPPETLDRDARAFMDLVRKNHLESALALTHVGLRPDSTIVLFGQARDFLNAFRAESLKLIGWNVTYAGDTTGMLTYEARDSARTGLVSIAVFRGAGRTPEIRGFHWQMTPRPLAQLNAFTLRGKSAAHYLFLLLAVAAVVACVGGAIFAGVQRMGVAWILACVIGIGSSSINWTTGQQRYNPISFHLFGAGIVRSGDVAPWIVTWSLPLGTILMLLAWRRRRAAKPAVPAESAVTGTAVLVCAGLFLTSEATAQTPQVCSFDTAAYTRIDSVAVGLAPGLRANSGERIPPDYFAAALAIRTHFRPPAQIGFPIWARAGSHSSSHPDTSESVGYGLDGPIRFHLAADGHLTNEPIAVGSVSFDLIESITAAIRRADSAGAFAPPSRDVAGDHGTINLRFVDPPHTAGPNVMLMRITVPALGVDSPPELLSMPRISYPEVAREGHLGDRVVLRFVIREDGRPDTATIQIVQATYREFARATIRNIGKARFRPARIAGCSVPTLVNVPIDFRIRGHD